MGEGGGDELMVAVDGGGRRTTADGGKQQRMAVDYGGRRRTAETAAADEDRCRRMSAGGVAVVWMICSRIKFYVGGCY